jgi:hypothetical protein
MVNMVVKSPPWGVYRKTFSTIFTILAVCWPGNAEGYGATAKCFAPPNTGMYPVGDSIAARSYGTTVVNNEGSC